MFTKPYKHSPDARVIFVIVNGNSVSNEQTEVKKKNVQDEFRPKGGDYYPLQEESSPKRLLETV